MADGQVMLKQFEDASGAFISWVDNFGQNANLLTLHMLLADLQAALIRLPVEFNGQEDDGEEKSDVAQQEASISIHHERWKAVIEKLANLPIQNYRVIFDSLNESEESAPVTGWLADDLADIYVDLKSGLNEMKAGRLSTAIWTWQFEYFTHWGRHLSHAQSAIWDYLKENGGVMYRRAIGGPESR